MGLCLVLLLIRRWYNPDIWNHLYLGQRILETHLLNPPDRVVLSPSFLVNPLWLFQALVALLHRLGGVVAVTLGFAALWTATFALWFRGVRPDRSVRFGWPLAVAALIVCSMRFEERPEVVSYFFLVLYTFRLARETETVTRRDFAWFGATELLWACCHGYFLLGPALVGLRLVSALVDKDARWRVWAKLLGVVAAATCLTPYGPRLWTGVLVQAQTLGASIAELQPPTDPDFLRLWPVQLFWLYAGTTLFVALGLLPRGRRFAPLVALAGLVASMLAIRNLPLAVLMAAPLWREAIGRLPAAKSAGQEAALTGVAAVAGLLMALVVAKDGFYRSFDSMARFGFGTADFAYAPGYTRYLDETKWTGLVFNHPSDGGYLQFHSPQLKLYGDSRFANEFPIAEYFQALADPATFRALHEKHRFDGVLVDVDFSGALLAALLASGDWRLAYADLHRAFFIASAKRAPASERSPVFFEGQNLVEKQHGKAVIEWMGAIARAERKDLLAAALKAFDAAPFVPAPAVANALSYVVERADEKLLAAALPLVPKSIGRSPREIQQVRDLLGAVPPAIRAKYGLAEERR